MSQCDEPIILILQQYVEGISAATRRRASAQRELFCLVDEGLGYLAMGAHSDLFVSLASLTE